MGPVIACVVVAVLALLAGSVSRGVRERRVERRYWGWDDADESDEVREAHDEYIWRKHPWL